MYPDGIRCNSSHTNIVRFVFPPTAQHSIECVSCRRRPRLHHWRRRFCIFHSFILKTSLRCWSIECHSQPSNVSLDLHRMYHWIQLFRCVLIQDRLMLYAIENERKTHQRWMTRADWRHISCASLLHCLHTDVPHTKIPPPLHTLIKFKNASTKNEIKRWLFLCTNVKFNLILRNSVMTLWWAFDPLRIANVFSFTPTHKQTTRGKFNEFQSRLFVCDECIDADTAVDRMNHTWIKQKLCIRRIHQVTPGIEKRTYQTRSRQTNRYYVCIAMEEHLRGGHEMATHWKFTWHTHTNHAHTCHHGMIFIPDSMFLEDSWEQRKRL